MSLIVHAFRENEFKCISNSKFDKFCHEPLDDDVLSVPGLGVIAARNLKADGICCTTQLIGKFLTLKRPDCSIEEHVDLFYQYLLSVRVGGLAPIITICIAEKANMMIPGIFDAEKIFMGENKLNV